MSKIDYTEVFSMKIIGVIILMIFITDCRIREHGTHSSELESSGLNKILEAENKIAFCEKNGIFYVVANGNNSNPCPESIEPADAKEFDMNFPGLSSTGKYLYSDYGLINAMISKDANRWDTSDDNVSKIVDKVFKFFNEKNQCSLGSRMLVQKSIREAPGHSVEDLTDFLNPKFNAESKDYFPEIRATLTSAEHFKERLEMLTSRDRKDLNRLAGWSWFRANLPKLVRFIRNNKTNNGLNASEVTKFENFLNLIMLVDLYYRAQKLELYGDWKCEEFVHTMARAFSKKPDIAKNFSSKIVKRRQDLGDNCPVIIKDHLSIYSSPEDTANQTFHISDGNDNIGIITFPWLQRLLFSQIKFDDFYRVELKQPGSSDLKLLGTIHRKAFFKRNHLEIRNCNNKKVAEIRFSTGSYWTRGLGQKLLRRVDIGYFRRHSLDVHIANSQGIIDERDFSVQYLGERSNGNDDPENDVDMWKQASDLRDNLNAKQIFVVYDRDGDKTPIVEKEIKVFTEEMGRANQHSGQTQWTIEIDNEQYIQKQPYLPLILIGLTTNMTIEYDRNKSKIKTDKEAKK